MSVLELKVLRDQVNIAKRTFESLQLEWRLRASQVTEEEWLGEFKNLPKPLRFHVASLIWWEFVDLHEDGWPKMAKLVRKCRPKDANNPDIKEVRKVLARLGWPQCKLAQGEVVNGSAAS